MEYYKPRILIKQSTVYLFIYTSYYLNQNQSFFSLLVCLQSIAESLAKQMTIRYVCSVRSNFSVRTNDLKIVTNVIVQKMILSNIFHNSTQPHAKPRLH